MSLLLLDTTFLVDAERGADLDEVIADDDDAAVAAITVAELMVGVQMASGRRRAKRRQFVESLLQTMPVLVYGLATATTHAELLSFDREAGRPRGAHDLMIAATALETGRTVVSSDINAFVDLPGVRVRAHG